MQVPSLEEFHALQKEVADLKNIINRIIGARVTVEWVSVEVAQNLLDCSRSTVSKLTKNNELGILKTGKKVRISLNSIRAYLLKRKYEPTAVETRINSLLAT